MQSKGNAPTAAQKRWREAVRELGSVISGGPAVIHHPIGVTGKHNKIDIGHWWVIPLTDSEHKALHDGETFGYGSRKEFEKDKYDDLIWRIASVVGELGSLDYAPPFDVSLAIMDYHR